MKMLYDKTSCLNKCLGAFRNSPHLLSQRSKSGKPVLIDLCALHSLDLMNYRPNEVTRRQIYGIALQSLNEG